MQGLDLIYQLLIGLRLRSEISLADLYKTYELFHLNTISKFLMYLIVFKMFNICIFNSLRLFNGNSSFSVLWETIRAGNPEIPKWAGNPLPGDRLRVEAFGSPFRRVHSLVVSCTLNIQSLLSPLSSSPGPDETLFTHSRKENGCRRRKS